MNPAIYYLSSAKTSAYTYVPTEVTIGTQVWDQKNLDTAYYSDGTLIPNNVTNWNSFLNGAWRYHNDNSANGPLYGRLYNNYAYQGKFDATANRKSVAPAGWRVSTAADFTTLNSYLSTTQGGKMKETGLTYWNSPNTNATNSSLFSGRGSATKAANDNFTFSAIKNACIIWTETTTDVRLDYNTDTLLFESGVDNRRGAAIRLIKLQVNLTTTGVSGQTSSQLVSGSNVTSTDTLTLSERGICYSTTTAPTILNSKVVASSTGTGSIAATITGLSPLTTYYIRAYAITTIGSVFYGSQVSGATTAPVVTLTTTAVTVVGVTSLNSGGNITDDGGYAVSQRGVCWGTSPNPTKGASNFTINGSGTGSFTSNITGLDGGRLYYVRAYAITVNGTYYGAQQFNTTTAPSTSITTGAYSNVTALSVEGAATAFTNDGSYPITEVGFCWGTSTTPTRIGSSYKANGTTVATFSNLNSGNALIPGVTYYIRAYAYSESVNYTAYGAYVGPFTTSSATPTVTTNAVTAFNAQSITAGGSVTLTNGIPVLDKGLCWDLWPNVPVKVDGKFVSAGAGDGTFSGTLITGLTFGTRYNILAYSTNGYAPSLYYASNTIDQTTYTPNIVIETVTDTNPYPLSMICGGNGILDDATYPITEKGYCYSSSVNPPTIANTRILAIPQTGTASFTRISGALTPNVSYFVRAYALNSTTGFVDYGSPVTVTTPNDNATAITNSVTALTYQSATVNYTIGAGSYYPIITQGVCWSTSPNPTTALTTKTEISGGSGGDFSANLTGLSQSTVYYVRAYTINTVGTVYSTGTITQFQTEFNQVLRYAYSLRKVVDGYTGNAILVRRSSDNGTTPIGFTGVGNNLNEAALLAWVGAGDGFVVTWYDQSGNSKDITNATNARQPRIVSGGVVENSGSRPAVRFVGTSNHTLLRTDATIALNNMSNYTVLAPTTTTGTRNPFGLNATNRFYLPSMNAGTDYVGYATGAFAINMGTASTAIKLFSSLTTASNITAWKNNVGAGSVLTAANGANSTTISVGAITNLNWYDGYISEIRGYTGLSDRTNISTNIISYYNITV